MQYVVQPGDTLSTIAQRFGTTVDAIVQANNITDPSLISVGQVLTIPTTVPAPTPMPTPTPVPSTPGVVCPELRRGSRGLAVTRLQTLLKSRGIDPGPIDGIFGPQTEAAVKTFQAQASLPVTGVVDVRTWEALGEKCLITPGMPMPTPPPTPVPVTPAPAHEYFCVIIRPGHRGPTVRFLQERLRERGIYTGAIDGEFGPRTQRAVHDFQREHGLPLSGFVCAETWRRLGVICVLEPRPPVGLPIATKVVRGIRHILYTDKAVYARGERITITLSKTNITDTEITLRYPTSQIIEITATDYAGREVWRWSTGRVFTPAQRLITIFPGGTQVITEYWNQLSDLGRQVPPGTYTITATNLGTTASLSVRIDIR